MTEGQVDLQFHKDSIVTAKIIVDGLEPWEIVGTLEKILKEAHVESDLYGKCIVRINEIKPGENK